MEIVLVILILLQIGFLEQYYSFIWFLSFIFGFIFIFFIGFVSDWCILSWGCWWFFIFVFCVGVFFGVVFFFNGFVIGLVFGDVFNWQFIGIVFMVLGVVVLDFSVDVIEGFICVYLLDVVDSEEQDMVFNIYVFFVGFGGVIGYVLGGLDWIQIFLGSWFWIQNQVFFFFVVIIFMVFVVLYLFSIDEEQYSLQQECSVEEFGVLDGGELYGVFVFLDEVQLEYELVLDYLDVDIMCSKSDLVLYVLDIVLDLEFELLFLYDIEFFIFYDVFYFVIFCSISQEFVKIKLFCLVIFFKEVVKEDEILLDNYLNEVKVLNGSGFFIKDVFGGYIRVDMKFLVMLSFMWWWWYVFCRQVFSIFFYYGKFGFYCYCYWCVNVVVLIKLLCSMSDLYDMQKWQWQYWYWNQSGVIIFSGDIESEEGEGEIMVCLLWFFMLKMFRELMWLCFCYFFIWFFVIVEVVFYIDFMGQVIFEGDFKVFLNLIVW